MRMKNLDDFCIDCPDYGKNTERCKYCQKVSMNPKKDYWKNICEINERQELKGIATYGQRLEENTIPGIIERINYFEEEMVDALKYAEWIKDYLSEGKKGNGHIIVPDKEWYNWHDLSKDPRDLPHGNHDVLVCLDNGSEKNYYVMFYDDYGKLFVFKGWDEKNIYSPDPDVWKGRIAWKEIEPWK